MHRPAYQCIENWTLYKTRIITYAGICISAHAPTMVLLDMAHQEHVAMQGLGKTVSIIALILSDPGGPRRHRPLRRGPDAATLHGSAAEAQQSDAAALERAASACEGNSGAHAPAEAVLGTGDVGAEEPRAALPQAGEAGRSGCLRLARPGAAGEVEHRPSDRVAEDPAAQDTAAPGRSATAQEGMGGYWRIEP